jgi:hypothetical protein
MSVDIINEKRIKLVVNGGCLNPRGLAEKTHELVSIASFPFLISRQTDESRSLRKVSI